MCNLEQCLHFARSHGEFTRGFCDLCLYLTPSQPDTHLVDGIRTGVRASGIGEIPYLDPASTGRREALGLSRT